MSTKFIIDGDAIRQLADILADTELSEIEYEDDGRRIRVARNLSAPAATPTYITPPSQTVIIEEFSGVPNSAKPDPVVHPGTVKSPMVGTIYTSPEPGAASFVKVGDVVNVGQTLVIIEAMKVMNPIKAPRAGKVTQIFVQDGSPVEFGEPLMIIE